MSTPTTAALYSQIITTLEGKLGQSIPILQKAFLRVLAAALAGVLSLVYRFSSAVKFDQFPATANGEDQTLLGRRFNALAELGARVGTPPRRGATPATIYVSIPKSPAYAPTIYANGVKLLHVETGVYFTIQTSYAGTSAAGEYSAVAGTFEDGTSAAGTIGNLPVGSTLALQSTVTGLATSATVQSVTVTGADQEGLDAYRARVVLHTGARKHGGAASDYVEWARTVPNVDQVYPYAGATPGTVDVFFSVTDQPDGIPTAAQITAVADAMRFTEEGGEYTADRAPINDLPVAIPILVAEFDVEVFALAGVPDLAATQAKVQSALEDYFRESRPYCPGIGFPPRTDTLTGPAVAAVVQEVVRNDGGTAGSVVTREGGAILVARTLGQGEHCKLGALSWS